MDWKSGKVYRLVGIALEGPVWVPKPERRDPKVYFSRNFDRPPSRRNGGLHLLEATSLVGDTHSEADST